MDKDLIRIEAEIASGKKMDPFEYCFSVEAKRLEHLRYRLSTCPPKIAGKIKKEISKTVKIVECLRDIIVLGEGEAA